MSSTQYVDIDRTLQNLKDSQIRRENVEAIRDFVNHCAAEGISEVRQTRLASALKSLLNNFGPEDFLLREATEQELKQVISGLKFCFWTVSKAYFWGWFKLDCRVIIREKIY